MLTAKKRASWLLPIILLTIVAVFYFATRLNTVVSSGDENLIDVGEIQIVLNNWGTLHHTGYPLYTMLGAAFVNTLNLVGFSPAEGPSLFSLFWALVALGLIYIFVIEVTESTLSAVLATLFTAVTFTFWINATIPEVYSLYVASIVAVLILSRRLSEQWSDKGFVALGLLLGLAGGHHRLAVIILPAVAIYLGPAMWQQRRRMIWLLPLAGLAGAATFLVYVYLPLRYLQGADFVFGSPADWDGFWRVFIGPSDVTSLGPPVPADNVNYLSNRIWQLIWVLRDELSIPGLALGLLGLMQLTLDRARRATGLALLTTSAVSFIVGVAFPIAAVAGNSLTPAFIGLIVGIAYLPAWLWHKRPIFGYLAAGLAILLSIWIAMPTYNKVAAITHPPDGGRQVLDFIAEIPSSTEGPEPVLMIPWGNDYFLAYFARYISGELTGYKVVDHNANLSAYLAEGRSLYTLGSTFWRFPLPWWDRRLGGHAYLGTAAPNVVQLSDKPLVQPQDIPIPANEPIGDGISLVGYDLNLNQNNSAMELTLFLQPQQTVTTDYSISVRLTDQPEIDAAEDILAQQDQVHPVLGWNPTSRWEPGEIVRTVYDLTWQPGQSPSLIEVTFYQQPQPGLFENLGIIHLDIPQP